jgi:soluble lytic murein transglycosylase
MQKLVYENVEQALLLWKNLQTQYIFSTYEKQEVARIIGVELAAQGNPDAINWLAAAGNDNTDESAELWRVRIALLNQNWPGVLAAIAQLPTDQQRLEAWQYWQARALAEMGQTVNASIIYEDLARQQDYYGQLAAMQLGMKISKKFRTHIVEEQQLQNIADLPGMQRAHELFVLNFKYAAREEWQYQLNKLPRYQYLNAAQLATRWGWYECAIATNQLLGQKGDIALRYPLAFTNNVDEVSRKFNINPAWVYAEIRQESLFQTQAHSAAGAMGLMQLLPSTAMLLADKLHLNFMGEETLFDPNDNIEIGSDYLNTLLNEFHGNMMVATASYDAGPARIARWIGKQKDIPADIWVETIPWPETRDYVKNIMASTTLYEEQLDIPVSFEKRMKENI